MHNFNCSLAYKECKASVTMVNVTSNFTSDLKKVMENRYTRYQVLLQLFEDNFGLSKDESRGEQAEDT